MLIDSLKTVFRISCRSPCACYAFLRSRCTKGLIINGFEVFLNPLFTRFNRKNDPFQRRRLQKVCWLIYFCVNKPSNTCQKQNPNPKRKTSYPKNPEKTKNQNPVHPVENHPILKNQRRFRPKQKIFTNVLHNPFPPERAFCFYYLL